MRIIPMRPSAPFQPHPPRPALAAQYGDAQFGDQFGGGGGGFMAGDAGMGMGGDLGMGGASQGGGPMAVDNSSQGGAARGNKDRQSLIPATIKQLKSAPPMANGEQGFTLDGRDLYQVTICGVIQSADEMNTNLSYMVDDGTDSIMVKIWMDSDSEAAFAERKAQWKEGVVVRVIGQLRSFNNTKNIVAFSISPITDFNEYTFHFIEVVHTHLRHTKGPPPNTGAPVGYAAPGAGGMAMGGNVAAPTGAGYAAAPQAVGVQELVLKFFKAKGASSESGCTVGEAADALSGNGIDIDQVRKEVEFLVGEGMLYSTIDDDHYRCGDA